MAKKLVVGLVCCLSFGLSATLMLAETSRSGPSARERVKKEKPKPDLAFSAAPTVAEITKARVFGEPLLVPKAARVSPQENLALARATQAYARRDKKDDFSALTDFMDAHPQSPWKVSLLTDLGSQYYHSGYLSKAMQAWKQAWELGKDNQDKDIRRVTDKAVGELARMYARVGRFEELDLLFDEMGDRRVSGSATEMITGAHEGAWLMRNQPEAAFRCGPMALGRVLALSAGRSGMDERVVDFESTTKGTSLRQVYEASQKLGGNYQMAKRSPGAPVITPAVVHWKVAHFAALSRKHGENYLVQDPTFGDELEVSSDALDAEASGYFLVPAGKLPEGWQSVSLEEAAAVWGKGNTGGQDDKENKKCPPDEQAGGGAGCASCSAGMPQYSVYSFLVSLYIEDTPIAYTPAYGPGVNFTITYNQRDAYQPGTFAYSNLGPKWTYDAVSFVTDDASATPYTAAVTVYEQGGGREQIQLLGNQLSRQ